MPSLNVRVLACLAALAVILPGAAFAACTSPAAPAGKVIFNSTYKVMQYCNGTNWVNTGAAIAGASQTGCSSPTAGAGAVFYNQPLGVVQFCNGSSWVDTACAATRTPNGSGCTSPAGPAGTMQYETNNNELQFCDSTNWVAMGWPCGNVAADTTPPAWQTSPTLPAATVNVPYSQAVVATDTTSVTYSLQSSLPSGITFTSSTGVLAGTPTVQGTYGITIRASDVAANTANRTFTLVVAAAPDTTPPAWQTAATLPSTKQDNGNNSQYYSQTLSATDATTVTYSLQSGSIPTGLSFNTSTGALTGYPTVYGSNTFTIRATDVAGNTADRTFTLNVTDGIAPVWVTTSPLPQATVNTPYSVTFQATDSVSSVTYPLSGPISPATPAGMSYNVGTHTFSGTPQSGYEGTFSITIDATDAAGNFTTRAFTLQINPDPNEE